MRSQPLRIDNDTAVECWARHCKFKVILSDKPCPPDRGVYQYERFSFCTELLLLPRAFVGLGSSPRRGMQMQKLLESYRLYSCTGNFGKRVCPIPMHALPGRLAWHGIWLAWQQQPVRIRPQPQQAGLAASKKPKPKKASKEI
jgi:hypothetical protein